MTPKIKTKINRIWTSRTPKSAMRNNTPRESFPLADLLLEPALSLPSLLSTSLLGPDETDDGLEQDSDFTPLVKRRDSRQAGNAIYANVDGNIYEEKEDEEEDDIFGDDPPSMTLREILLNADTGHFHLLGLSPPNLRGFCFSSLSLPNKFLIARIVEEDQEDDVLSGDDDDDTSFMWE